MAVQPQTKQKVASNPPVKRAAQPQKYFTFNPSDPRSHLKIKPGQQASFAEGLGWFAAPGGKPTTRVVKKAATPQDSFTTIESPAQIEARVKSMADSSFASQQKVLNDQAEQLRKEAEGRRMALQSAYQAAAQANAGMGTGVQDAWEHAANTITGLAGTATGGVADALKADLATQEQALSRVGAGGTGFDALSQAAPEQYRSGIVPGEFDVRMGALGNTWLNQAAQSLNARGLQEGIAAEGTDRGKINSDLMKAVSDLTAGRSDYETKLREQLLGARSDQIKAIQDQQQFDASLAVKKVQIEQAQQKIDNQFQISLASAQTAADRAAVYRWKAQQDSVLSAARNSIAQQNADAHMISANASATRAVNATKPGGGKPPSASSVSTTVARANKAGTDAFTKEMTRLLAKQPGAHAPKGTSQKDWALQPEFQAAKAAAAHEASIHDFGNLMYRVIESMNDHLRPLGWNAHQIKKAAYELVSATIPAPPAWLQANPGYGPKA